MLDQLFVFLKQGGFSSFFIGAAAIALVVIAAERFYFLFIKMGTESRENMAELRDAVSKRNYPKALQMCNQRSESYQFQLVKSALLSAESGREALKAAIGGEYVNLSKNTDNKLPLLALIASASTLLGLLGTISGLIKTFASMAEVETSHKAMLLGQGISEAMYSTGAGLAVGLAAMVAHTLCANKANQIKSELRKLGYDILGWIESAERLTRNG